MHLICQNFFFGNKKKSQHQTFYHTIINVIISITEAESTCSPTLHGSTGKKKWRLDAVKTCYLVPRKGCYSSEY